MIILRKKTISYKTILSNCGRLSLVSLFIFQISCKKAIQINPPANSIVTAEAFQDSTNAASAIAGIYAKMLSQSNALAFGSGLSTVDCGKSSDELIPFDPSGDQIYSNGLTQDMTLTSSLWIQPFFLIYQANACIEGVENSTGISAIGKRQFIGEAKFMRAFSYFYLVNFFGDVPLITTTDYHSNSLTSRTPKMTVYQAIISDLTDAQNLLSADYSYSNGERIRANKFAATALLARAYLYVGDYKNAEAQSSLIINNSLYSLSPLTGVSSVFMKNSSEAILQLQLNATRNPYNATPEGYNFNLKNASTFPTDYLSSQLLNSFETGDQRKTAWVASTTYMGTVYYYPYKYKVGPLQSLANAPLTEYYMILRLAEQYLIRAEAEANGYGAGLSGAVNDINVIRHRAGLLNYTGAADKNSLLTAIIQERKIEFFAEWANRWLDLKRLGQIDQVMMIATPLKNTGTTWQSYQQLYPIPLSELQADPNLTQNPGY